MTSPVQKLRLFSRSWPKTVASRFRHFSNVEYGLRIGVSGLRMINQSISAAFPYRLAWETIDSVTADWVSTVYPLSCRKYPGYARGVQSKLKPWYIQAVYRRAAQSSNVENLPFDPWFSHVNLHFELVFPMETLHFGESPCLIGRGQRFLHGFPPGRDSPEPCLPTGGRFWSL